MLGNDIHYLYPLYQGLAWEEKFRKKLGSESYNDIFSQLLSFAGDYKKALEYGQKNYGTVAPNDVAKIKSYVDGLGRVQSVDAKTVIAGNAMREQVVMINEAHNNPQHRAFIYSLLEDFYREGFRYLAMETFTNREGYTPKELNTFTGYYTNEPVGGELVRKALELGFTLYPYEDTVARHTSMQRDSAQAAHLFELVKKEPKARILVVAGYGHIAERQLIAGYTPMAMTFKTLSGIDPLTIDQTSMSEGSSSAEGNLLYKQFMQRYVLTESSIVLVDKKPWLFEQLRFDFVIVHPPAVYHNNRPDWLSLYGARKETLITPGEKKLFLLQAYYADEYNEQVLGQLVPADQTYTAADNGYYSLYLRPGKYKLVSRDISYKKLSEKDLEVK